MNSRKNIKKTDNVRPSRDGHEFHEVWAARKALQLLMPTDELIGIAVEGPSPADQEDVSKGTVEIADLVLYHGKGWTFNEAHSITIIQMKYSICSKDLPFRASDAKKTIHKFTEAFKSYKTQYKAKNVANKLKFQLITNRPIDSEFDEAISCLASGSQLSGNVKKQAIQFATACGLEKQELVEFAKKFQIIGIAGNLRENKQNLSRILVDWSAGPDPMARARLGNIKQLLRDKAGSKGEGKNVITKNDIIEALELQGIEDLFPCPNCFPDIGMIVEREQLSSVVRVINKLEKPLLIHADGGVGKTVFLQSLAKILSETHEIILFDCFGGGTYRAPEDARHLPRRGLIHIINNFACDGLCDPLLPSNTHAEDLVKAFRKRLEQTISTLQRGSTEKQLILFLDAIDNAAEHAKDKNELAFPKLLLESIHHYGNIAGVKLVVSCRTYRRDISKGDIPCEEFELKPFSQAETEKYLRARFQNVSAIQIQVAHSRSEGNPRVLEHLALGDRGLLAPTEINKIIKVDELIKERINKALRDALKRGYEKATVNVFLAGLSVLPPPVPIDEYADALGMDLSVVKSFAADLAPLLERTKYGLMFRDEPTETLIREIYTTDDNTLRTLAKNLFKKQEKSVYAARALPSLLQKLGDGQLLFELAFDNRFPSAITSTIGKQNIRYSRLNAAILHAARHEDYNRLIHLLIELSTLVTANERGADYVLDNPDMVIISRDVDATRRLFETRPSWPGTRYARLTIANVLSGDLNDASQCAIDAYEWINHFFRQDNEYLIEKRGPEPLDIAAIPLFLIAQNKIDDAINHMRTWNDLYSFEVAKYLFILLNQAQKLKTVKPDNIYQFLSSLKSQSGVLAAAISFFELDNLTNCHLIKELSKSCKKNKNIEIDKSFNSRKHYRIQDCLFKASAIAIALRMQAEACSIMKCILYPKPRLWDYTDRSSGQDLTHFVTNTSLNSIITNQTISEHTLLPQELVNVGINVPLGLECEAFKKEFKAQLDACLKTQNGLPEQKRIINHETKRNADYFLDELLEPLLEISNAFRILLSTTMDECDKPFLELFNLWVMLREKSERYSVMYKSHHIFDQLGLNLLIFSIWTRTDIKDSSIKAFLTKASQNNVASVQTLIQIISILSKRSDLQELLGETALKVYNLILREEDVIERASLFARLSRAIMPASLEEAAYYFHTGLEQMDAIGSGDFDFTRELLLFAAELKGDELENCDFHTLSNICELNISSEAEKFPWVAFARGLARTSGCRTLPKLGRWHDREKISLEYTLMPYLAALIEQDKINPSIALGLLRLTEPEDLYGFSMVQIAEIISKKRFPNSKELLTELMMQFEQNQRDFSVPTSLEALYKVTASELDENSEQCIYYSHCIPKLKMLMNERNAYLDLHRVHNIPSTTTLDKDEEKQCVLNKLVNETNPVDELSLSKAIDEWNRVPNKYDLEDIFFECLRKKTKYSERTIYIRIIAGLAHIDVDLKLRELKVCKEKWCMSSISLQNAFCEIGLQLIHQHAYDIIKYDHLNLTTIAAIGSLSNISVHAIIIKLIVIFIHSASPIPASIWINLATIILPLTKPGEGQLALKRLLISNSAKISSNVVDGEYNKDLYITSRDEEIAAGLVWQALGSPHAASRWRAAHSLRCFARLGKWNVIDLLIENYYSTNANPYQAPELPFYYLNARLWLLIAISRMAIEHPQNVAKYVELLKKIALDQAEPHILLRHFASRALLEINNKCDILLKTEIKALRDVNKSPFPKKKIKEHQQDSYYQERERPDTIPKLKPEFSLDYDFDKTDVTDLSNMFDKSRWETKDSITAWVRKYDPTISNMYENCERFNNDQQDRFTGMCSWYHRYGQQLGCHAFYLLAGEYLSKYPVVQRSYSDDSWCEWLQRELLSRNDDLWLADGIDRVPIDTIVNLFERGEKKPALTGQKAKILALLKIKTEISHELVVAGHWYSMDNIDIRITTALIPSQYAKKYALLLSHEGPFQAWLPQAYRYNEGSEDSSSDREPFKPWIVWPSNEARLDKNDPLGAVNAIWRYQFTNLVNKIGALKPTDPFCRKWV